MTFEDWKDNQLALNNLQPAIFKGKLSYPYNCSCPWAKKYKQHVDNQRTRHGTDLSFDNYLYLAYQASLNPENIGNKPGKYQLGRIGDKGRYSLETCRFITFEQNNAENIENGGDKRAALKRTGELSYAFKGYYCTPMGKFPSIRLAAKANGTANDTIRYRTKSPNFPEFYFEDIK